MEKIEILKDKIETLRNHLNQAIADELPSDIIYEKSVKLDKILEEYLDIVASEK